MQPESHDPFNVPHGADNRSPIPNITAEELGHHLVYIRRDLREIKTALMGNQLGTKGVFPRLDAVESKVDNHDRKLLVWGSIVSFTLIAVGYVSDWIRR